MPSTPEFAIEKRGQQINIRGKIADDTGKIVADFGPNGTNFVPWFQQLTVDEQLEIAQDVTFRYMVQWLIKQAGN